MIRRVPEKPRRTPQEKAVLRAQIREVEAKLARCDSAISSHAAELKAQVDVGALSKEEASHLFDEWMAEKRIALLQRREHIARHFGG